MSSSWGENLRLTIFGESHGSAIGVTLDGFPAGVKLDSYAIEKMMSRRAPGRHIYSTKRSEPDKVEIVSGVHKGFTTGNTLTGIIRNKDTRSKDYENMPFRPSHGDYTGHIRYSGYNDPRGGGHFSARLTAPLVFAGALSKLALKTQGITVGGNIFSIYNIKDNVPEISQIIACLEAVGEKDFPVFDDSQGVDMQNAIEQARLQEDSLGGAVSCFVFGLRAGIGSPIFGGLENKISSIIFGIPAVKGIEFGSGFEAAKMCASIHNDSFEVKDNNVVATTTNNHGGIIGGISSGMPVVLRVAFKPTPSISRQQKGLDIEKLQVVDLTIKGRHDPCVVPRAVPCVEAAVAIAILDSMLEGANPNRYSFFDKI